jgi:hypothetical protein
VLPIDLAGLMMITVHPDLLSPALLPAVTAFVGVGAAGDEALRGFAARAELPAPAIPSPRPDEGLAIAWLRDMPQRARLFRAPPARSEQHRHKRKYAEGELGDHSFYFKGSDGRLNLRAQNLAIFSQIAEGVDAETWRFHFDEGHIGEWFRFAIKDAELTAVADAARAAHLAPEQSRAQVLEAIRARYTAPA